MNNRYSIQKQDVITLLILFPPLSIVNNYLQFGEVYFSRTDYFTGITLLGFTIWLISWRLHLWIGQALRMRLGGPRNTVKRTLIVLALYIPFTALTISSQFYLCDYFGWFNYQLEVEGLKNALISGLIFNCICISFHEGTYLFASWKQSLLEAEDLKKAHLQSQFDGLKNQVNPHFLFNSLNSLSSLISENPEQAEKFLTEMSKVYRYLLQNNEYGLVSLATELRFAHSYFHLLKTRYEDGIFMEELVDRDLEECQLPPLTLQLLLENAVKHNVILPQDPLTIHIFSDEHGNLVVRNNLKRKINAVASHKVGLANIREKYRLLGQPPVTIAETDSCFTVCIPLIKKHIYENIDSRR